ncbi:flagellar basal body rod protein FlgB [Pelagibacteraceae bacterium]|nr:flagellar basal body rod protein FlgB [Pelagibacteraceae bacterium]
MNQNLNIITMNEIKKNINMLGNSLSLRAKRNEILASNIANAATPNYKARDIDFDTEIKKYQKNGPIEVTHGEHLSIKRPVAPGKVLFRDNVNPSLDGNTVELAVEQLQFAENSMRYQSTLSFLSGKINTLMSAIKGE